LSIEKDNDWSFVTTYNWVAGGTRAEHSARVGRARKPKRGQPLYQEDGDWTKAPPTLQFVNFIDQADVNYADFRDMNVMRARRDLQLVHCGRRGQHDLKFGAQYQLGEHYREDQRFMNGAFQSSTDQVFNAADPRTYPERLTIRVPQMVQLLSRTLPAGLYVQDKVADDAAPHVEHGVALRLPRLADSGALESVLRRRERLPGGQEQLPAARRVRVQHDPTSVIRGGYRIFYEKQWIDRFENYSLNRVFTNSFQAQFPTLQADPGPSRGQFPTDPLLVNGPTLNRDLVNQLVPPGTLARNTAAVWLDTPDRILPWQHQASIGYERQIGRQLSVAADYMHIQNKDMPLRYNLNPRPSRRRAARPITRVDFRASRASSGCRTSRATSGSSSIGETKVRRLNLAVEKRFSDFWGARLSCARQGRGQHERHADGHERLSGCGPAQSGSERGPTNADRRHAVTLSGRIEVPWVQPDRRGVARFLTGTPFTIHDTNVDVNKNNLGNDPLPAGTYSGTGLNAITVENAGGRNGAYGPGTAQFDLRAGCRLRPAQGRSLDFFFEVFNVTNEPNFANPSGDLRSGATFLVPTSLNGGGFPRQFQIGARFGF
jgi:hypothetical protein